MKLEKHSQWVGRHSGKDILRKQVWTSLMEQGISNPDSFGHIPAFEGSDRAADRLSKHPIWMKARVIKCNPDTAQLPVRINAIADNKILYMAVPRLELEKCFIELTNQSFTDIQAPLYECLNARNALNYGKLVGFEEMQPIDLVITGCVAVSLNGGRIGKGAGFADLELGMLREFGLITGDTPIISTVHQVQIVDSFLLPMQKHDSPLDWIFTPDREIQTNTSYPQPTGLDWSIIRNDQFDSIPMLRILQPGNKQNRK